MLRFDVVVLGAGPGGASAALRLVQKRPDLNIALIDRLNSDKFPRYHRMCGEGISRLGLQELDLDYRPYVMNDITSAVEEWPGGIEIETSIDGCIIDRPGLLQGMRKAFQNKGGTYLEQDLENITGSSKSVTLHMRQADDIFTEWLIAADGARSKVREKYFESKGPELVLAEQFVLDEPTDEGKLRFTYDEMYRGGYKWTFPHGNKTHIGFPKGCGEIPEHAIELHRRAIPIGGEDTIVKGKVCLVGDAAGDVNPITFGGMRTAFTAGRLAGDSIANGSLVEYQRKWTSSKYAHPCYIKGYRQLCSMNNIEMQDCMEPFRKGYSVWNMVRAAIIRPRYFGLYRSFDLSIRYGW